MDERLIELYVQRGRLRERIGVQRGQLARELAPLSSGLQLLDRAVNLARQAQVWMATHPMVVTAVVVAVVVWRPRSVWRTLRWGYSTWRSWARLRAWFGASSRAS
jgi:hypothetical protein